MFTVSPDISDQGTVSDVTVAEGDNATLTCKAVGHPKPKIQWKREDLSPIKLRFYTPLENITTGECSKILRATELGRA